MADKLFPEGIVAFRFTQNECYTEVVKEIPEGLVVDLDTKTWVSHGGLILPFGRPDVPSRMYSRALMIICVYDVREFQQLQGLLYTASSIANEGGRRAIDCG